MRARALNREWEYKSLIKEFSLIRGKPNSNSSRRSLQRAIESIRKRFAAENWGGEDVTYDPQFLIRSRTWWYVPDCWIGCAGFIVNMGDGYVNWLGSALKLRECFWDMSEESFMIWWISSLRLIQIVNW
jgi:hypothetical protein